MYVISKNRVNVSFPSGTAFFGSSLMHPDTTFYHVFSQPGTYHYVCTMHETAGMRGTVIVRSSPLLASKRGANSTGTGAF